MNSARRYGDSVAHSLGIRAVPPLKTQSLPGAQVAVYHLQIGAEQLGMTRRIPAEDTFILAIYLSDTLHHELWSRGRPVFSQGYVAGSMRIVNLVDEFAANITHPHEALSFYIPRAAIDEMTDEAGGRRIDRLSSVPGTVDPVLLHLGSSLLPSLHRPCEASALFTDHVVLAACAHMLHRYGGGHLPAGAAKGGLAPFQAERAKDFMAAHCAEDVSLAEVATHCGLSRGHFAKAFRASTGLSPHQWRQRYRIEKVKAMLIETNAPVAEIALACGFADQSHLTRTFTRYVGDSPAAWRRHYNRG